MEGNRVHNVLEAFCDTKQQFCGRTIQSIWKLREEYVSYRIFLWLDNEGDVDVFTYLSFSGIMISGFCNEQPNDMSYFFGKQVVDIASIICDSDVIIIYGKEDSRKAKIKKYEGVKAIMLSYDELFVIREEIYEKEAVIVYDSVNEAGRVANTLQALGIRIGGYCSAMSRKSIDFAKEKEFDQGEIQEDKYNIILASTKVYCEKTISSLQCSSKVIFVPSKDIFYSAIIITLWGKMALHLNNALQKGKRFFLYGTDSCYTNSWFTFLCTVGIKVEKIFNDYEYEEKTVDNIYNIVYENLNDVYVILNKEIGKWEESCDLLEGIGLSFNKMYTGLYAVAYRHLPELTDISLGHVTTTLMKNTEYEGFRIYGEGSNKKYRIVVLGGSTTTSEAYRIPCWPQILYNDLVRKGYEVVIFNGAVDGYSASDELYKLIRDVRCLHPDLIISFSGVNNRFRTLYPYVSGHLLKIFNEIYTGNFCKGIAEEEMTPAQIWVQQEQMMSAISQVVYQAKFICFAQPMYMSKGKLSSSEKLQFTKNNIAYKNDQEYRKQVSDLAGHFEWMIDLQDYFDNFPDVFFDEAHVYEKGNQMIAKKVYEYICNVIPKTENFKG